MDQELAAFFREMFAIDVKHRDLVNTDFPTFEEVLGLTDLAIMRKEAFRRFDVDSRAKDSGRLRLIAQYLVFLVAKVLDERLRDRAHIQRQLVTTLRRADELRKTVFVSTNYDILIDNSLTEEYANVDLDYGAEFRNFDWPDDWQRPRPGRSVFLFKPHGSLNWLFCPACNELQITPKEKGVVTRLLISDVRDKMCAECGTMFVPLIVPPTFYKDLSNAFLSSIWNRTDIALRKVNQIIICGYSFPDADIHIKYLLKRAQTNRDGTLRITVINQHPDKDPEVSKQEKQRYERFLGATVNYTGLSFGDFAANPMAVVRS
jgi:hypothetical protein